LFAFKKVSGYFCEMQEKLDQIKELESSLTGEMFHDADIRYRIHSIQTEVNGTSICSIDDPECEACGS
jgi:hypothetical protein